MGKFEKGDRVTIVKKYYNFQSMQEYVGETTRITGITHTSKYKTLYLLGIDNGTWSWKESDLLNQNYYDIYGKRFDKKR